MPYETSYDAPSDRDYFGDGEEPDEEDEVRCPECGAASCDECDMDCSSWFEDDGTGCPNDCPF